MRIVTDNTIGDRTLDEVADWRLALDLFCGVGGACRGLQRFGARGPGWDVIGIDSDPTKARAYPGVFIEHDLREGLPALVDDYDFAVAWASPPCGFATSLQFARSGENLIPLARRLLREVDAEVTILENVPGAREHLHQPVRLCGSVVGLDVRKHRLFETNHFAMTPPCDCPDVEFAFSIGEREAPVDEYRQAHGFRPRADTLGAKALREAIPPQYVDALLGQYIKYAPYHQEKSQNSGGATAHG